MAFLNPKKYQRDLAKILFPSNEFMTKGRKDDNTGNYVQILYNESVELSGAEEGSPALPLSIQNTEYGQRSYDTVQLYTPPELVKNEDEMTTNFGIYQDHLYQKGQILNRRVADNTAKNWGPTDSARIRLTTGLDEEGGTVKYRNTTIVSGTNYRKRIGKTDILWAKQQIMKDNTSWGQIVLLVTPDQHEDIRYIPDFFDYEKVGVKNPTVDCAVGRILGVEVMVRWNNKLGHAGLHYNQSKTKKDNYKADGTVNNAADDGAAALMWSTSHVRYALSPVETWIDRDKPEYLGGTLISNSLRHGATISRSDEVGVVALVDAKHTTT